MAQDDGDPVEIIGVHPVPADDRVYLLEVVVRRPPKSFDVGQFTQENPDQPRMDWQVAYDERYLSSDGTLVVSREGDPPEDAGTSTRLAFFMFFLDLDRPLLTPFGPLRLPPATPAPARLAAITSFEPPD